MGVSRAEVKAALEFAVAPMAVAIVIVLAGRLNDPAQIAPVAYREDGEALRLLPGEEALARVAERVGFLPASPGLPFPGFQLVAADSFVSGVESPRSMLQFRGADDLTTDEPRLVVVVQGRTVWARSLDGWQEMRIDGIPARAWSFPYPSSAKAADYWIETGSAAVFVTFMGIRPADDEAMAVLLSIAGQLPQ